MIRTRKRVAIASFHRDAASDVVTAAVVKIFLECNTEVRGNIGKSRIIGLIWRYTIG